MHHLADIGIDFHPIFDQTAGVKHRPVIATAESLANHAQRAFRHMPRQEHGDLSWEGDVLWASFAGHVGEADVKMFGDLLLNDFDAN